MDTPSYIAKNTDELFDNAPENIQDLFANGDVDATVEALIKKYTIKQTSETALSNVISFLLIGAIAPEDGAQALQEVAGIEENDILAVATDLDQGILKKSGITLFSKSPEEIKVLEFQGTKTKEELRQELLKTTKRESGFEKDQSKPAAKKSAVVIAPGSRAQLLEQLQVLETIPNDDEIGNRLSHIQTQIAALKKQEEDNTLDSKIALKSFLFGEKGKETADPTIPKATFSIPPTRYNVDPYREVDTV
jgi:hypothetical protein